MANLDWSDRANVGCLNGHVRNAQQYSSHNNNCRFPNWQRPNTPKKHHYPLQPSQRQTGKPPTLLRLDSAGESVEDFPNSPHGPFEGRSNARTPNSFLGNILSKVGYPLHPNGGTYLARTDKSPQGDINLDRLVEKFNSSCEMEPPHHQWPHHQHHHHHQSQMANQEVHLPERQSTMQPAKIVPAMTFNGGPYITWSSQDNRPRTFPAYYRFLNFVHFHPYNNATRIGRTHIPPLSQPPHAWSGRIPQFHQQSPHKQCHPLRLSKCDQNKQAYHPRETKQFSGGKPKNNERMMQIKSSMSHPGEHSTALKATSSHGITDANTYKGHGKHIDKSGPQAAEANSLFVYNEKTSHTTPSNRTLRKEDNCRQSTIQSGPCEMPRASLSESMSTNTCSNSDPDDKVLSKQDRFECTKTRHLADVCTKSNNKRSCEKSCSSSLNIPNEQKDEKCNTISRSITSDDVTKPNNEHDEQEEKYAANEPNSSGSKQMHSSIAYLLADYVDNSAVCSNDSDFSEEDEDAAEDFTDEINDTEIDNASLKLWESFQTSDPYNPIYGWKCLPDNSSHKDQVATQETADNSIVKDSTLTFNDSGVSVIQQSPDNDASSTSYSSTDDDESEESSDDEWSQDSGCDEEEQRIWDSLCRSNDPYDPMGGWRLQPSSASPTTNSLPTVPDVVLDDDTGPNNEQPSSASFVTKSVPTLPDVVLDDNTAPTNEQPTSLKSKLQPLPLHETFVDKNASSTRHPSVSFILGADDYSDSDSPDPDDYETSDKDTLDSSAKYEDLWQSFESSSDPYNPINGWNCQSPSLLHRSASSPSELCKADTEEHDEPTPDAHADGGQQILLKVPSNVSLIQSSSTGCLKSIWKKALQRDKETKAKKVSFCTQEPVIISPEIPMWENEYKEARCGHWEELARDRCRFQRRICEAELIVAPCFTPAHRMKVFQKLYS